jgi:hypothetical protein
MVDVVGRAVMIVKSQIDKSSVDDTGTALGRGVRKGALIGVAALGTLAAASVKSALAFEEAESVQRRLNNTLDNMGKSTAVASVDALTDSLMRKTGVDDAVIKKSQTILATFSEVAASAGEMGGTFERASRLALDLGATGFGNAEGGAKALGKALQDPVKGISALSRAGVTFTPTQKEMIENFIKTGEVAKAQNIILAEVEKQVGGNAEAGAKGSEKLRNAFGELEESFGHVLDTLTGSDDGLGSVADKLFDIADTVDRFADSKGLQEFVDFLRYLDGRPKETEPSGVLLPTPPGEEAPFEPFSPENIAASAEAANASWWEQWTKSTLDRNTESLSGLTDFFSKLFTEEEFDLGSEDFGPFGKLFEAGQNVGDRIGVIWEGLKEDTRNTIGNIKTTFSEGWAALKLDASNRLNEIGEDIRNLPNKIKTSATKWRDAGATLITEFFEGLKTKVTTKFDDIAQGIKDAINRALPNEIVFFGTKGGIPAVRVPVPQFAGGGFAPGGMAWVGEQGPELVSLPRGSQVHTASDSERMSGNTYVYAPVINGNVSGPALIGEFDWANRFKSRYAARTVTPA